MPVRMILDIKQMESISMKKLKRIFAVFFLPFTGFWYFGWLWEGRIFVRSCTVCIAEWQQAAENRHDYFPGV